jgi:hypothetical protein
LPLPKHSSRMGQWVCKGSQPTVILSPGRVYTATRPKNGATYHLLQAIAQVHPNSTRVKRYCLAASGQLRLFSNSLEPKLRISKLGIDCVNE